MNQYKNKKFLCLIYFTFTIFDYLSQVVWDTTNDDS